MKGKMAVLGDGDSVLAFSSVGIEAFPVCDDEQAKNTLKLLAKNYSIIFITEDVAKNVSEVIDRYNSTPYPIILPIPSGKDSNGYGMQRIKQAMYKALGVDLLFNNQKDEQ